MVMVSVAVSSISSSRTRYLSSSRTLGSVKSSPGMRCAAAFQRDHVEAGLGELARHDAAAPPRADQDGIDRFHCLGHVPSLSAEVRDRLRLDVEFLAAIELGLRAVARRQPGIADHAPRYLVAVAAVDRIGEEAFHGRLVDRLEKRLRVEVGKFGLARLHGLERGVALRRRQPIEILAVGLAGPGIGGLDAGGEDIRAA